MKIKGIIVAAALLLPAHSHAITIFHYRTLEHPDIFTMLFTISEAQTVTTIEIRTDGLPTIQSRLFAPIQESYNWSGIPGSGLFTFGDHVLEFDILGQAGFLETISFPYNVNPALIPDSGATALLLGLACLGLFAARHSC